MIKRLLISSVIVLSLIVGSISVFANEDNMAQHGASNNFSILLSDGTEVKLLAPLNEDEELEPESWSGFRANSDFPGKNNVVVYLSKKIKKGEVIKIKANNTNAELYTVSYLEDGEEKQFESADENGYYSIPAPENYFAIGVSYSPNPKMPMSLPYDLKVIVEYKEAFVTVMEDIAALPENVTLEDAEKVKAIRDAYDYLDDADKEKITNYNELLAAEAIIDDLKKIDEVEKAIDSLPDVSVLTVDDKEIIEEVKQKLEALSENLRTQVSNTDKLALAEAIVERLIAGDELAKAKEALKDAQDKLEGASADKDVIKVLQQSVKKIKAKAGKKKTTVSWKSLESGYQYEIYVSKKLSKGYKKSVTTSKNKAVVKKIGKGKLKSKKTYYIKVRGFKTIDGKKVYTQFSEVVKVKIK